MPQYNQSVKFNQEIRNFAVGTGKDCKIFLNIVTEKNGKKEYYNVPLTTLISVQVFTSTQKEARRVFGQVDAVGLTNGFKRIGGHITAVVFNESIVERVKRIVKHLTPVQGSDINLDTDGALTLKDLEGLRHLDEIPLCQIKFFLTEPITKKVYSRTISGVKFTTTGTTIGGSAVMAEQYSFVAFEMGPMKQEKVTNENTIDPNNI